MCSVDTPQQISHAFTTKSIASQGLPGPAGSNCEDQFNSHCTLVLPPRTGAGVDDLFFLIDDAQADLAHLAPYGWLLSYEDGTFKNLNYNTGLT